MTKQAESASRLSRRLMRYANRGLARIPFLREASKMLLDFSQCDALELWLRDPDLHYRWEAARRPERSSRFVILSGTPTPQAVQRDGAGLERLCRDVIQGRFDASSPCFTRNGSFWTGDTRKPHRRGRRESVVLGGAYRSLALLRFAVHEKATGLLQLKSLQPDHFTRHDVESYDGLAQTLGLALGNRRVQWALRERVKELTCLYGIARVAQRPGISLAETLQGVVELLPPAWQYPSIACARIVLDGRAYTTGGFQEGPHRQAADIVVGGARRGAVEVVYTRDKPELADGPFLKEEQSLLDTAARELALIVARREAEDYQSRLQDQLRHADRLATIGQLAAGVAHELNEPLGNILGFAQLAKKNSKLPKAAAKDMEKIVRASLHAREVIHKLLIFARQMPPLKTQVNLNQVVEEGLYFLESRCAKAGIQVVRVLAPDLPAISADPSQLHQVLVNLVVNAVQAMPEGGTLTIETVAREGHVSLMVQDTGAGMSDEVKRKIFVPFFTTKDVNEGTGLGLAVVHGIVTAHGGSIRAESEAGRGARFEIQLPVETASVAEKSG